jgi:pimeloyl-ACP methyl ester carboxylesterase
MHYNGVATDRSSTSGRILRLAFLLSAITVGAYSATATAVAVNTPVDPGFEAACAAIVDSPAAKRAGATQATVESVPAVLGASCVVRGRIVSSPQSTINYRIDLPPASRWNSKLLMAGGGGFDGFISTDNGVWLRWLSPTDQEFAGSFARASSDSGHQGRGANPWSDFSWVVENPVGLRNHADEANHLVNQAAVAVISDFYGRRPMRRYLIGASNGGRAGLVAAQRHPTDYDGIVALEPAISQEAFAANLIPEMLKWIYSSSDHWLDRDHIALYERAELNACDALDGLKDGILGNPAACHFDAAEIECRHGDLDSNTCLTPGQVESIHRIFKYKHVDVALADGVSGYPGYGRGAESEDWQSFIFGPSFAARGGFDYVFADNTVKWAITKDPNSSVMTHDPTQWKDTYLALSSAMDATNPDLGAYASGGGKLIVWHGIADNCVTYQRTAEYLDAVKAKLGSNLLKTFLRFYTSPAVGHGMQGPGPASVNFLAALDAWVESGSAPKGLVAAKYAQDGREVLARPLCEFPGYPRYKGGGNPNAADSFSCVQ